MGVAIKQATGGILMEMESFCVLTALVTISWLCYYTANSHYRENPVKGARNLSVLFVFKKRGSKVSIIDSGTSFILQEVPRVPPVVSDTEKVISRCLLNE